MNSNIQDSIWHQDLKGEWKLFFNFDIENIENTNKNDKDNNKISNRNPIISAKSKILNLGTLVMTPKGIGRLLKLEGEMATVTMSKTKSEENFPVKEVSNYFTCFIKIYDKEISNLFRLIVPVNANVEIIKRILIEMNIVDLSVSDYLLITNGTELKDEFTFEQLGLKNKCKILLTGQKLINCKVNRFSNTMNWWYSYNTDGITFSCNKKIKLTGVGMYGSHEGKIQSGVLKIYEVEKPSNIIYEESLEIQPAPDQANAIIQILFKKPIIIKQSVDYTVQFLSTNYCYLYYGTGGKDTIEAEKGVEFYYKFTQGSNHGTNVQSGNFPEFYYFA